MRWYKYIEAVLYIANASTSRSVNIYCLFYRFGFFPGMASRISLPGVPSMDIKLLL